MQSSQALGSPRRSLMADHHLPQGGRKPSSLVVALRIGDAVSVPHGCSTAVKRSAFSFMKSRWCAAPAGRPPRNGLQRCRTWKNKFRNLATVAQAHNLQRINEPPSQSTALIRLEAWRCLGRRTIGVAEVKSITIRDSQDHLWLLDTRRRHGCLYKFCKAPTTKRLLKTA